MQTVVLGQGSFDEARRFHNHYPLQNLFVSTDLAAFRALELSRGGVTDFFSPAALMTASRVALRALTRSGTLGAKMSQFGPGQGDIRQMGGVFLLGPGQICDYAYFERTPGDYPSVSDLLVQLQNQ